MSNAGTVEGMKTLLHEIAAADSSGNTKTDIARVARATGLGYRRAFGFWYGTARSVSAEEWIAADTALMAARRQRAEKLRAELAALEESLGAQNGQNLRRRREDVRLDGGPTLECG